MRTCFQSILPTKFLNNIRFSSSSEFYSRQSSYNKMTQLKMTADKSVRRSSSIRPNNKDPTRIIYVQYVHAEIIDSRISREKKNKTVVVQSSSKRLDLDYRKIISRRVLLPISLYPSLAPSSDKFEKAPSERRHKIQSHIVAPSLSLRQKSSSLHRGQKTRGKKVGYCQSCGGEFPVISALSLSCYIYCMLQVPQPN